MNLNPKEYLLLISPLVALLVAIITTLYNIRDRRKYYEIESKKILVDFKKTILKSSSYFEDKYRLYISIMNKLSDITKTIQDSYKVIQISEMELSSDNWNNIKVTVSIETLQSALDDILKTLRSNQAVVPRKLHLIISRKYWIHISKLLNKIHKIIYTPLNEVDKSTLIELKNIILDIRTNNDHIKDFLYTDLQDTISNLSGIDLYNK